MYQTRPPFLIYGFVLREYRTHSRLSIKHFQLDFEFIGCAAGGSYVRNNMNLRIIRYSYCIKFIDTHVVKYTIRFARCL